MSVLREQAAQRQAELGEALSRRRARPANWTWRSASTS
jgi:hypothetical protein